MGAADGLRGCKDGRTTIYRTRDGLPDDRIGTIFEDSAGRISRRRSAAWPSSTAADRHDSDRRARESFTASSKNVAGEFWITDQEQGLVHLVDEQGRQRRYRGRPLVATITPLRSCSTQGGRVFGLVLQGRRRLRARRNDPHVIWSRRWIRCGPRLAAAVRFRWRALGSHRQRPEPHRRQPGRNALDRPRSAVRRGALDDRRCRPLAMVVYAVRAGKHQSSGARRVDRRSESSRQGGSIRHVRRYHAIATPIGFSPPAASMADGRLWFAAPNGVGVVDPRGLPFNTLPPR